MASNCYFLWRKYVDTLGNAKWVNEGPAPDGACPSCPESPSVCPDGAWDGVMAACQGGHIRKVVCDGSGGYRVSNDVLVFNAPVCSGSNYTGSGPISNYFP